MHPSPGGVEWPPQRVPFPVNAPFRAHPDLRKLADLHAGAAADDPHAGVLVIDERYPAYAQTKRQRLADRERPLVRIAPGPGEATILPAVAALARLLSGDAPEWIACPGPGRFEMRGSGLAIDFGASDGAQVATLPGREDAPAACVLLQTMPPAPRALAALALSVQDDLVLMREEAGTVLADAFAVALPSGWDPADKLGRTLAVIHAPVADSEALRAASAALGRAMVARGPFVRYVWTLAETAALARWPGAAAGEVAPAREAGQADAAAAQGEPDLRQLWFRCERQVTLPMAALGRAAFLIRVFVAPLAEVAHDAHRRARLVAALRSMTPAMLAYKGLTRARETVLRAWGEDAPPASSLPVARLAEPRGQGR
jgi:hypothetical protein